MHDILKDKQKNSPIQDIFGGSFQSQVVCLHCNFKSDKLDPIMDISLDIKNCESIEQAFFRYTTTENLVRENQYKCEKCNRLRDAQKRVTIKKAPQILTIQLKRFGFFSYSGSKVTRHIQYPEVLKLRPFSSDNHDATYHLYGVLVHAGHTCNSGHYYAFVKNGNTWFRMDDELTQPVTNKLALSQPAYLLFYQKANVQSLRKPLLEKNARGKELKKSVESLSVERTPPRIKDPEISNGIELQRRSSDFGASLTKNDENGSYSTISSTKVSKNNENIANGVYKGIGMIPTSVLISNVPSKTEKSIEFLEPNQRQSLDVDLKSFKVNSTVKWKSNPIRKSDLVRSSRVNSTVSFTARPIVKKLTDLVSSLTGGLSAPSNDIEPRRISSTKDMNSNKTHSVVNGADIDADGNSFRMALLQEQAKLHVRPWNHLATTDTVFQRNQLSEILAKEQKRKRPSRNDIEYEAPLLKGLKKKQKKLEKRIMAQ
jgi:hypothetical protein